jgi:pimeloyl-ACP methyl ester carboxylesterase
MEAIARALTIPCLLVRGGSSELVTEEAVARFTRSVPQARCVDIAAARHMVAGDRNDAFTDAVTGFLADL